MIFFNLIDSMTSYTLKSSNLLEVKDIQVANDPAFKMVKAGKHLIICAQVISYKGTQVFLPIPFNFIGVQSHQTFGTQSSLMPFSALPIAQSVSLCW